MVSLKGRVCYYSKKAALIEKSQRSYQKDLKQGTQDFQNIFHITNYQEKQMQIPMGHNGFPTKDDEKSGLAPALRRMRQEGC